MTRSPLRKRPIRPSLSNDAILRWADEWFSLHGKWPNINSGRIPVTIDDTWKRIDDSLRHGYRGLPEKSGLSLARLLAKRRGVRNSEYPPRLSVSRIEKWARNHKRRTGQWPREHSGAIHGAPGETWLAIDMALRKGRRGLRRGSSLARLLARRCGVRNPQQAPRLTATTILRWADVFYRRHGRRPTRVSGPITIAAGETWMAVNKALSLGRRGFSGGSSLARLLDERRPKWGRGRWARAAPR